MHISLIAQTVSKITSKTRPGKVAKEAEQAERAVQEDTFLPTQGNGPASTTIAPVVEAQHTAPPDERPDKNPTRSENAQYTEKATSDLPTGSSRTTVGKNGALVFEMERSANHNLNTRGPSLEQQLSATLKNLSATPSPVTAILNLSGDRLVNELRKGYPELNWLTGSVDATPDGVPQPDKDSPSLRTFGKKHIEFDRTALGLHALSWALKGDRESFTAPQKSGALSRESFDEMRDWTKQVLPDVKAVDAMVAYTVLNDLGKIKSVADEIKKKLNLQTVDHDVVLRRGLETIDDHPDIAPSFARQPKKYQDLTVRSLQADFNIGQFLQGENAPASLQGLKNLDREARDFYLVHALYDIAGATGHVNEKGSIIVNESFWKGFSAAIDSFDKIKSGAGETEVYRNFIASKAAQVGLPAETPKDFAVARLAAMSRANSAEDGKQIQTVFDKLPKNAQAILERELNRNGIDDGLAMLPYYSPALLSNAKNALSKEGGAEGAMEGLRIGMMTLSRALHAGRIATKKREGNGVVTLMMSDLANLAKTPRELERVSFELNPVGKDFEIKTRPAHTVDRDAVPKLDSLAEAVPGQRVGVIGIGGGSDVVQASQLGSILEDQGKDVAFNISVRRSKTASQGTSGKLGEERTIQNHGGEIAPGVFLVKPESQGSGRFLENLAAKSRPTFLVIDDGQRPISEKINAVIKHTGGIDTAVAVDTGGDSLYPAKAGSLDAAKATPDQDLEVLKAMTQVNADNKISTVVAAGVDTPENVDQVLQGADASRYELSGGEKDGVFSRYKEWQLDGSNESRYGKTPFSWQLALAGKDGLQVMPIPTKNVTSETNPWNPFVVVNDAMADVMVMNLDKHLKCIQS